MFLLLVGYIRVLNSQDLNVNNYGSLMHLSRGVSHKEEPQDDPDQAAAPDVVDCELNKR